MKTTSQYTPKVIGAFTITAMMLIEVYVFLISPYESSGIDASIITNAPKQEINPISSTAATVAPVDNPKPASQATVAPTSKPITAYKDGMYIQKMSYAVPGETNTLTLSLTVESDVVTAVAATHSYEAPESRRYITGFDSGISGQIVGTKLKDVKASRIGGASLTTAAFMRVIPAIEAQAIFIN